MVSANISSCGLYRYELTRAWAEGPRMPIIMLNPSTADAENNDPTIRRCIHFAKREGYAGLKVVNLYAFRASKPNVLFAAKDPVGPDNDRVLEETLAEAAIDQQPILAAWGAHWEAKYRAAAVRARATFMGARLIHLGKTKDGQPRHPLYASNDAQLETL